MKSRQVGRTDLKARGVFVTGTDTGVGKTLVAAALLRAFVAGGLRAVGMKPVAAGAHPGGDGLVNEDVEALIAASNVAAPRSWINPFCFEPALAPHLAADMAGRPISLLPIARAYSGLQGISERVVVEGAGGLLVPLNSSEDFADLAHLLELPLLLVVGMRLGCLNHALLTAEVAQRRGLRLAGWVANTLDPAMAAFEENLACLRERLPMPLLGRIPHGPPTVAQAAGMVEVGGLDWGPPPTG